MSSPFWTWGDIERAPLNIQNGGMTRKMKGGASRRSSKDETRPTFLKAWRRFRGYSQEQLAEMIGTTHVTVGRIERGEQPWNQHYLAAAAEALNCDIPDLLIRDPLDPEGIWSVWDHAKPGQRQEIVAHAKVIINRRTGT